MGCVVQGTTITAYSKARRRIEFGGNVLIVSTLLYDENTYIIYHVSYNHILYDGIFLPTDVFDFPMLVFVRVVLVYYFKHERTLTYPLSISVRLQVKKFNALTYVYIYIYVYTRFRPICSKFCCTRC